ncbi:hypothetical protein BHE74_00027324, partial [Ensete ventricosum]
MAALIGRLNLVVPPPPSLSPLPSLVSPNSSKWRRFLSASAPRTSLSPPQCSSVSRTSPPDLLLFLGFISVGVNFDRIQVSELGEGLGRATAVALLASSVFFADPALAFKSILRQANFKGAKLLGASFFDADLTGCADLSDADLRGADFSLANVTK